MTATTETREAPESFRSRMEDRLKVLLRPVIGRRVLVTVLPGNVAIWTNERDEIQKLVDAFEGGARAASVQVNPDDVRAALWGVLGQVERKTMPKAESVAMRDLVDRLTEAALGAVRVERH